MAEQEIAEALRALLAEQRRDNRKDRRLVYTLTVVLCAGISVVAYGFWTAISDMNQHMLYMRNSMSHMDKDMAKMSNRMGSMDSTMLGLSTNVGAIAAIMPEMRHLSRSVAAIVPMLGSISVDTRQIGKGVSNANKFMPFQ